MIENRTVSVLFADLKGFSAIRSDELQLRVVEELRSVVEKRVLTPTNHFISRTQGDGYFIASNAPEDLAEITLQLRDAVRNKDWSLLGLATSPAIRIALHIDTVKALVRADGSIEDIVGMGVNLAARIEPVTEPNEVYCSELFHMHLKNRGLANIIAVPLGDRELAKGYGVEKLYRLVWANEMTRQADTEPAANRLSAPPSKLPPTDKQQLDFLYQAFSSICSRLAEALRRMPKERTGTETEIREQSKNQFVAEIYENGRLVMRGRIWIGSLGGATSSIMFYDASQGIDTGNTYNEILTVDFDDKTLFLSERLKTAPWQERESRASWVNDQIQPDLPDRLE